MTKEEAIDILETTGFVAHSMTDVDTALDMAIEALEGRPKAKWVRNVCYVGVLCSECKEPVSEDMTYGFRFCPYCGAEMEGADK